MDRDIVKESFQKVKQDILDIKGELVNLKEEMNEIQFSLLSLIHSLEILKASQHSIHTLLKEVNPQTDRHFDNQTDTSTDNPTYIPAQKDSNTALRQINQTEQDISTHSSTQNYPFKALKDQDITSSIGNRGVSTDRQTDNQTDTSTQILPNNQYTEPPHKSPTIEISRRQITEPSQNTQKTLIPSKTAEVLEQLDTIKKDLRLKFKRLTTQEMFVYSSIYQFEDQGFLVDYSLLSTKLGLSESSIRDYIQRILNKGISLEKEKINNKRIILHIPQDMRKLASLETVIGLREL